MTTLIALLIAGALLTAAGLTILVVARWHRRVSGLWLQDNLGDGLLVPAWAMLLLGTLCLCVFMANFFGVLLWLGLLVILVMALRQRYVDRRRALLQLLAAATRAQRPLAPAILAFAQDSQGNLGRQSLRLNMALESGSPLAQALATVGPLAPLRGRALLYLGQQTNQLTSALEEAAKEQELDSAGGEIMAHLAYLFWLVAFGAVIVTFVMLKIVPAFRQIFADFGTELPAMTQLLIGLSDMVGELWPLVLLLQLVLGGVFIYSLLIYVGWIPGPLPLPLSWLRGLETAAVLRGLALATQGDRPLEHGLGVLAMAYPVPWMRRRLEMVGSDVASGLPWWESLWLRRLISPADCSLLQAAQRLGNVPWALRAVADRHRWRTTYRLRWWLHVLGPPLLTAMGMLVGFIVLALFLPLIKIIETLT